MEIIASVLTNNARHPRSKFELLGPVRQWLENLEIQSPKLAQLLCNLIPATCPFERDIKLFNKTLLHISPLCKLNPLYEQVAGLRFKALSYLADECGEDVAIYC